MPSRAAAKAMLDFRGRPYGVTGDSRFDLFTAVPAYRLGDEADGIATPLLVTDPDHEQFFPGRAQQLFDRLTGPKGLVRFTSEEVANGHCEPLARSLRDTRIYDWLEGYLR
jgi:hypothetical protein